MKLLITSTAGLSLALCQYAAHAAYYPTQYQIFNAGYNKSINLQEKLSIRQGEYFFRKSGIYVGANDSISNSVDDNPNEEAAVDTYAGLKKKIGNFGYHLGLKSYNRTLDNDVEIQELYLGGSFKNLSVSYASNNEGEYSQVNLFHTFSNMTLGVHLGKTEPVFGQEFMDWSIHASRVINKSILFNAIMTKSDDPLNDDTQFNLGFEKQFSLF